VATFTTPIAEVFLWDDPLMRWYSIDVGVTVVKTTGEFGPIYRQVQNPSAEELEAADAFYLGGRTYTISAEEAVLLTSAGYGAGVGA
jgi:hypothetical protein